MLMLLVSCCVQKQLFLLIFSFLSFFLRVCVLNLLEFVVCDVVTLCCFVLLCHFKIHKIVISLLNACSWFLLEILIMRCIKELLFLEPLHICHITNTSSLEADYICRGPMGKHSSGETLCQQDNISGTFNTSGPKERLVKRKSFLPKHED